MKKYDYKTIMKIVIQFMKFGIVGVSNTIISLMVYYILIYCNIHYIIANTMGFIISVLNAYYWNNKYIFMSDKKKNDMGSLIRVFISYGSTFLLNTGLLYLMVNNFNISSYIAPIINVIIITPINFLLNKFWAFK